MQDKNWPQFA
jgi:hypothetical protein